MTCEVFRPATTYSSRLCVDCGRLPNEHALNRMNEKLRLHRMLGIGVKSLTPEEEIKDRLARFNASRPYDWSIFDDVPWHQQVEVMYPFTFTVEL